MQQNSAYLGVAQRTANAMLPHSTTLAIGCAQLASKSVPAHHIRATVQGAMTLQTMCHGLARASGWWDEYDSMPEQFQKYFIGTKISLVHSEVSETLEGARKGLADNHLKHRKAVEVELADAVIRIFDLAGGLDLDLTGAIIEKLAYNQHRADHTREARSTQGGKSF